MIYGKKTKGSTERKHALNLMANRQLNSSRYAQVTNLLQHLLNPVIQLSMRVLVSCFGIEVLLYLSHAGICLGAEAELDLNKRLEAGIEVRHTQVDELWEFVEKLLVQLLVGLLGHFRLALGPWKLGGILVWLLDKPLDLGPHSVVIQQLVIPFLDTFVDVGEVGTESGYRIEDSCSERRLARPQSSGSV